MAIEFNLLSGATIDADLRILYDILRSGECFLGFGRNYETWGQGCLIRYTAANGQAWPNGIVGDATDAQYYDENFRLLNLSSSWKSTVFIAKYDASVGGTDVPDGTAGIVEWLPGDLIETIFINDSWILLRGVDPTYEWDLYGIDGTTEYSYFIFNSDKNFDNLLKVDVLSEFQYPGLSTRVQLRYAPPGAPDPFEASSADPVPGGNNLERRLNVQGEYMVTGIGAEFINWFEADPNAKQSTFFLVDTDGALLLDKFTYEETVINETETAYIFAYFVETVQDVFEKRRFKLTTLTNVNNRMCVFHESLPVRSSIAPVADNNPPGLPVAYIRHPDIHNSLFDVVGAEQIVSSYVWMCKEIPLSDGTDILTYYTDLETSLADPDTLTVDVVGIDWNTVADGTVVKYYAKSKDPVFAAGENMNSIMVDMTLAGGDPPAAQPTGEIYRQLWISWKPQYYNSTSMQFVECGTGANPGPSYSDRATFFNVEEHKVNTGTLLYVANKYPVYRKYLQGDEIFKIIL